MNHWIVAPVLLPVFTAGLLVALYGLPLRVQRAVGVGATALLLAIAVHLLLLAGGGDIAVYRLGDWAPPFGIVLVLDRLSALMLVLTAALALCAALYASHGADEEAVHFHALFQFQLMGLNMAFLTGDLFNLFVAFEILLIASYALLVFGGGAPRARAGLHYAVLNLVGSALFLLGVGTLYGLLGTLNMADLARAVQAVPEADRALVRAAALLLLAVFALKAAALPLLFWLPRAYAAASAPVAALFAVMTKVGVYAIVRVFHLLFGDSAGEGLAGIAWPWLWPVGLATVAFGAAGALSAHSLRMQVAWLVVVSSGTLLSALAHPSPQALAAALFYLPHTTLTCAGLFLLADRIGRQRGGDALTATRAVPGGALLYLLLAGSIVGLPPLSGFLAKLLILQGVADAAFAAPVWAALLLAALAALLALSRSGSLLFWHAGHAQEDMPAAAAVRGGGAIALLVALTVALAVFAQPVSEYVGAAAQQIMQPSAYVQAVLPGGA